VTGVAVERICFVLKNWYSECISNLWFQYGSCHGSLTAHDMYVIKFPQQKYCWDQRL